MSRPYQMVCSKCGANITMAGSEICTVCTPIGGDNEDWTKQPLLCAKCFAIEHNHSVQIGDSN